MDCNLPGSSNHGILLARILEWVAISFFRGSSWPRDQTCVALTGIFFTTEPPGKPTHMHRHIHLYPHGHSHGHTPMHRDRHSHRHTHSQTHGHHHTHRHRHSHRHSRRRLRRRRRQTHTLTLTCTWTHIQFSSVAQSCPTRCDPMDCSTPGFPVHHQLPEFTQTHVHRVGDAIQPSHPLSSPSPPAFNLSQHQGLFQWVSSSHQVAKVLEFQLQHQSFQWTLRINVL